MRVNLKEIFLISSETAKTVVLSNYFTFFARAYSITIRRDHQEQPPFADLIVVYFLYMGYVCMIRIRVRKVPFNHKSLADTVQDVA
jgi:hypothetical protein